jgi:hypothetical protein
MPRPKKPADERAKERVPCPSCGKTLARATLRTHRCERRPRARLSEEERCERAFERAKRRLEEVRRAAFDRALELEIEVSDDNPWNDIAAGAH